MLASRSRVCLRSLEVRSQARCLDHNPLQQPQQSSRAFHSSRPNQLLEFLEPVSQSIEWGFQTLHTQTGLPWYLTIPLGASIVRMTWTPILFFTSSLRKPREEVTHLTSAWRQAYKDSARIKFPGGTAEDARKAENWVQMQLKGRVGVIRKHQGYVGAWVDTVLSLSFIPIWVLSMDCVRRMAGDTRTITSIIWKDTDTGSSLIQPEPGLQTEGFLWIDSLVSADPLWALPISYGVLATYSIWLRVAESIKQRNTATTTRTAAFFRRLSMGMLALPSFFTFMIIRSDMSTAVVLYLLGTTVTQLAMKPMLGRALGTTKLTPALRAKMAKPKAKKGM